MSLHSFFYYYLYYLEYGNLKVIIGQLVNCKVLVIIGCSHIQIGDGATCQTVAVVLHDPAVGVVYLWSLLWNSRSMAMDRQRRNCKGGHGQRLREQCSRYIKIMFSALALGGRSWPGFNCAGGSGHTTAAVPATMRTDRDRDRDSERG